MRMGRVLLTAAVAALMVTGAANAAGNAWFELLDGGTSGATASEQGSGHTLVINKSQDPTVLQIGFFLDTAGEGIFGPALGMFPSPGASFNVIDPWSYQPALDNGGFFVPIGPAASGLTFLDHGATSAAAVAIPGLLMFQFELVIDKPFIGTTELYAFVGQLAIATATGYGWLGNWGANVDEIAGYPDTPAGPLPVIVVNNFPEPATIALLGLGAVALIRRRR